MRVLIASHTGLTECQSSASLTEYYQKQTRELCDFVRKYFRVGKVYCSPFLDSQQSMVSMESELMSNVLSSDNLWHGQGENSRGRQGLSLAEALDRIMKILTNVQQTTQETDIPIIISHENVLSQLLSSLSGESFVVSHPDLYMVTFHKEQATKVQRIWSDSGPLVASDRSSARAILLNPKRDGIYMFELVDPHMVTNSSAEHRLWITPGGGVNLGEDLSTTLERELWEELSLKSTEFRVLGHLWTSQKSMIWKGLPHTFIDNYFLVELTSEMDTFERDNLMEDEIDVLRSGRWWSLEELAVTKEKIVPTQLRTLLKMDLSNIPPHSNIEEEI